MRTRIGLKITFLFQLSSGALLPRTDTSQRSEIIQGIFRIPRVVNTATPSLNATYFHFLIPALAKPVAQSQTDRNRAVNVYWTYEELSYPSLDFLILATEPAGICQCLALGSDVCFAVFHYSGVEQLTDHLDILTTMVM